MDLLLPCHLGWIITWSMCRKQVRTDSAAFLLSSFSFFSYVHRPSTKTIWFWRKEISISTHSLPGRPIPMHTSPTSTPTMTINPRHLPYHRIGLYSFLCALYWDSSHHAWDKPTLRLYGSWYVIKHRHTVLPTEGNPHFLSGALRYTWKAQCFGGISCLDSHSEIDNWISWCGLNKNKRNKKTTKKTKKGKRRTHVNETLGTVSLLTFLWRL